MRDATDGIAAVSAARRPFFFFLIHFLTSVRFFSSYITTTAT